MKKLSLLFFLLMSGLLISSCSKDEPPLPDNTISFSTDAVGFEDSQSEIELRISASRAVDAVTNIVVDLEASGLSYGTHFSTSPAATDNKVTLSIPAGSSETALKIKRSEGVFLEGSEAISVKIAEVSAPALVGSVAQTRVAFKAITSGGSELQLNGGEGGASAINSVFVDLSANQQTAVKRDSWDLGFYAGEDFRVITNNTSGASVIRVDKTDLSQVSSADFNADDLRLGRGLGSFALFDDVNGDLSKTAISAVSATAADNKVYIINRSGGSGAIGAVADLYKVRVVRKDAGYTLQYARVNENVIKTLDVLKDTGLNFKYVSFDNGAVSVEPAKSKWDLQWGWSMYFTGTLPYGFSDLVFVNHLAGVQAAEILTSTVSYENFKEANLAAVTFSSSRNTIGSGWRATTGTIGVSTDRFYVIKDAAGNIYKLKFISFTTQDGGERGKPKLAYSLVKKAA